MKNKIKEKIIKSLGYDAVNDKMTKIGLCKYCHQKRKLTRKRKTWCEDCYQTEEAKSRESWGYRRK